MVIGIDKFQYVEQFERQERDSSHEPSLLLYSIQYVFLRSCSSIGANAHEAKYAQSKADFINKMEISLKECYETEYWFEVLFKVNSIDESTYKSLLNKCGTIRRKLIASITTAKNKAKE